LTVTGRPAQFGRAIMQDVAAKMLADFAHCLSQTLADGGPRRDASAPQAAEQRPAPAGALDLGPFVRGVLGSKLLKAVGVTALAALLARLARRRRR
jgi:hypothetical protein